MSFPIIDAHHHVWELARTPWLQGPPVARIFGDYAPLRRDYSIEEFMSEAVPEGVVGSIYVQINVVPGDEVSEVARVAGAGAGFVGGVVGFANLAAADVADVLDRQQATGALRGIRQQLHWHERADYRFALRPDTMLDPAWQAGLREVERRGLVFELQVFPGQFDDSITLVDAFPNLQFVLLHAGMPENDAPDARLSWSAGLTRLAERPQVAVKLSGLGTFDRACELERWAPIVRTTVAAFGPERCLWGSNFPIEKLWTDYASLVSTMRACLADLGEADQRHIFHDTAARLYRVDQPS